MTDYRVLPSKVTPIVRIEYRDTWTCCICERREADTSVVIDDVVTPICSTCFERADERGGDDA